MSSTAAPRGAGVDIVRVSAGWLTGKDSYIDGLAVQDQLGQIPEPGSVARRAVVVAAPQLESRLIRITGRPASVDHLGPGPQLWRFAMRQAHERRRGFSPAKAG